MNEAETRAELIDPALAAGGWGGGGGKLTDEESNGPGERARPRVRLAPDMSKIPPACGLIFLNSALGGACWCTRGRARSQGLWRYRAFSKAGG